MGWCGSVQSQGEFDDLDAPESVPSHTGRVRIQVRKTQFTYDN
jgi:hypothetical protein